MSTSRFLPFIYNELSEKSFFNTDLTELFGTEDGAEKGLVGRWDSVRGDFKSTTWDWNPNGFKLVVKIFYYLWKKESRNPFSFNEFEEFYNEQIRDNIGILRILQEKGIFANPCRMVYVIKYRGIQFPALLLEIQNLKWSKRRMWVTFKPIKYFVIDDSSWKNIKKEIFENGDYNGEKWIKWLGLEGCEREDEPFIEKLLKDTKQRTFGLMPLDIIDHYREEYGAPRIFYLRKTEKMNKRETHELPSDNQVFWYLFHHITKTPQVIEELKIPYNSIEYSIRGLLINTVSKKTFVYRQEFGVANTLCKVLLNKFGGRYIDVEFSNEISKNIKDTTILRRAFKVSEIPGEESNEYAECNYDYAVNLECLGTDQRIFFDLTTALWRKGALTPTEYFKKWGTQLFETILNHDNLKLVWYITIDETEEKFYETSNVGHNTFEDTLNKITEDLNLNGKYIIIEDDCKIQDEKIIVLPIFRKTPNSMNVKNELSNLVSDNYQDTKFYQTVDQVIKPTTR